MYNQIGAMVGLEQNVGAAANDQDANKMPIVNKMFLFIL